MERALKKHTPLQANTALIGVTGSLLRYTERNQSALTAGSNSPHTIAKDVWFAKRSTWSVKSMGNGRVMKLGMVRCTNGFPGGWVNQISALNAERLVMVGRFIGPTKVVSTREICQIGFAFVPNVTVNMTRGMVSDEIV